MRILMSEDVKYGLFIILLKSKKRRRGKRTFLKVPPSVANLPKANKLAKGECKAKVPVTFWGTEALLT